MKETNQRIVRSHGVNIDKNYVQWIQEVKQRFRNAQIKTAIRINSEQLYFNWCMGRDLMTKRAEEKWGKGVIDQISLDLQAAFPSTKGFSARNLWFMKQWYLFYAGKPANQKLNQLGSELHPQKCYQPGGELYSPKLKQVASEIQDEKLQQVAGEVEFPSIFASIPWMHHVLIIQRCSTIDEALEDAIEKRMTRFLLELGNGWAFVGRQKEIFVSGKARRIDLLFYHIYLRCYVVLELKAFEPEFAGKLNFYVNAVNEFIRRESDNPTLGLLICKDMDRLEVRLAFQGNTTPWESPPMTTSK